MKKLGYVSLSEAEEYDYTLIYKIGDKTYSKKIVDYFQDDGIAFKGRDGRRFTLDDKEATDIQIVKYDGQFVYCEF